MICPKCECQLKEKIENGLYGCDSGCEYIRYELECVECDFYFYEGEFGYYEDEEEKQEYLENFRHEALSKRQAIEVLNVNHSY